MRVLLVDDEPPAIERLAAFFANIPGTEIVGTAVNGIAAQAAIERLQPDLVMLDIQMPEMGGLALAGTLPLDERPEIVFVTAFEQFAPDAFEVEAADYLLKPVRLDRLRQAVERAKRRQAGRRAALQAAMAPPAAASAFDDAIWVQIRDGQTRVPVAAIDWIEAAGDYAMLHTPLRSHLLRTTMSALERRIDPAELMRVHRSAFVRLSRVVEIRRIDKWLLTLVLSDGAEVAVGPNYAKAVAAALSG
ncbi:LytR/AlgR family response regulator transcription factor [Sphingomonas colocasiae]|uniref:LytTR family DNA-binding domain-containing protein n=1 Tax=Sphingomonas colocasiae TaxID=1848973 RepID=A0ABS7PVJ0_9SPHN|nr:LytTR family DNA-binding domain-containing protein [Sphingomonas colocasiae]MBY8825298.1 LytTR family DNA-binding domain-containing protein [Sphingomonas colocasiae]